MSGKKLKVLQVNKLYSPVTGGIERIVQYIAEGLKDDVDMQVLVCQTKGRGRDDVINGVKVHRAGSMGILFSLPISFPFLFKFRNMAGKADIVHIHCPFPLADLACMLSGYKGKVVVSWHSDVVKQKKLMLLYRPVMEWLLKRADVIIVSANGIIEGSSYLGPYKEKCRIIPFAVNPEVDRKGKEYLETLPLRRIDEEQITRFLFVGRLVYYKGVDVLLRAFAKVENAKLHIVGSGELENQLKNFVYSNNMSDKVSFKGNISDQELEREFEDCDVFVLPSVMKSEAFGLVQQEAMAYGKPVINTKLKSGVPEVSVDGETGITVEPGDVDGLTKAMQELIDNPVKRLRLGKAARKKVDEQYTMEVMLERVKEIYENCI